MPVSAARAVAFRILRRVEVSQSFAVDSLQSDEVSRLSQGDRNLATELVMGVLRWRGELDDQIERISGKPLSYFDAEILEILRLGVYQVRFLSRIPKRAAVNEAVELTKAVRHASARGLVNAVLRKCEESSIATAGPEDPQFAESARRSIPGWMRERWEKHFGAEITANIVFASQSLPRTHLRVGGDIREKEAIRRELAAAGVETRPGAFARRCLVIESGAVQDSPPFREGRVTIQDEGSQLAAELVNPRPGEALLDLCAAPGVKSGQLAESLQEGAIVACDRSLRRLRLMDKVIPANWPRAVRLHRVALDATAPLPFLSRFAAVLADVPCSGTGTLARNPEVKWRLKAADLERLAETQAAILRTALASMAAAGRVVYVTCSLEPEENEDVIAQVLAGRPDCSLAGAKQLRREFPHMAALVDDDGFFRTRPGDYPLDGFFAAVIQ